MHTRNVHTYIQVSLPLISVLGQDSKSAEWLTVFLTEIVTFNLSVWSSEDKLCVTSVELFNNLVKLNSPRWADLGSSVYPFVSYNFTKYYVMKFIIEMHEVMCNSTCT